MNRTIPLLCVLLVACNGVPNEQKSAAGGSAMNVGSEHATATQAAAQVSGVATYRERIALPPDAVFEALLEDTSRADAAARVIAQTRLAPAGLPPFEFTIHYDPAELPQPGSYAIRARVTHADRLLFTTDQHYPLPQDGQSLELLLVQARGASPAAGVSTASLENTYWKLMRVGDEAVTVAAEQREPHFVLHSAERRVAGYGGCNRMTGSYTLSGEQLSFSQMAGTMMACADGMQHERAFHDALAKTARWRIEGERLELIDSAGVTIAEFESRYLR